MADVIMLNSRFSTTRNVTGQKPTIVRRSGDKFDTTLFLPQKEGRRAEGGLRKKGYFKTSLEQKPLLTVVTVVFNGQKHLEQTIQSVVNQSYDNVEYIVIDGGSTDGTLDIIKKYDYAIDYWVSEPDGGISDAFNKGIMLATGKYVLLLNSGDAFIDHRKLDEAVGVLDHEVVAFQALTDTGNIFPDYVHLTTKVAPTRPFDMIENAIIAHQGCFVDLSVYKQFGLYNQKYKLRMDFDFFVRIQRQLAIKCIKKPIILYDTSGLSSSLKNRLLFKCEEKKIVNQYYQSRVFSLLFCLFTSVYLVKKTLSAFYYSFKGRNA